MDPLVLTQKGSTVPDPSVPRETGRHYAAGVAAASQRRLWHGPRGQTQVRGSNTSIHWRKRSRPTATWKAARPRAAAAVAELSAAQQRKCRARRDATCCVSRCSEMRHASLRSLPAGITLQILGQFPLTTLIGERGAGLQLQRNDSCPGWKRIIVLVVHRRAAAHLC